MPDGLSPWERRHKNGTFKGKKLAFGQLIQLLPPEPVLKNLVGKFEERLWPGIFLGYQMGAGGKWRGVYTIAPLSDFRPPDTTKSAEEKMYDLPGRKGKQIRIFNLPDVYEYQDRPLTFPLADAYREAKTKVRAVHDAGEGEPEVQDEFEDKEYYVKKPAGAEVQGEAPKYDVQDLDGKPIDQILDEAMKEASTIFEPALEDQPKVTDKPPEPGRNK